MYIHYFSHHAPSLKRGVLSGLFLRALRFSSPCFLQTELDILWAAFRTLGYPTFFINKSLSQAKTKHRSQSNPTPNPPTPSPPTTDPPTTTPTPPTHYNIIPVPYSQTFDHCRKYLYGTNNKLVYNYRNTTQNKVARNLCSTCVPKLQGGVYNIPCKCCDRIYYGRTARPFEVRLAEHMKNVEEGKTDSALVKHMESHPGHEPDFSAAKLIWKSTNVLESKYIESSCIKTLPNYNVQSGEVTVDPILASIMMKLTNIGKHTRRPRTTPRPRHTSLYPSPAPLSAPLLPAPPHPPTPALPRPHPTTPPDIHNPPPPTSNHPSATQTPSSNLSTLPSPIRSHLPSSAPQISVNIDSPIASQVHRIPRSTRYKQRVPLNIT